MQVTTSPALNWCIRYSPSTNPQSASLGGDCDKMGETFRFLQTGLPGLHQSSHRLTVRTITMSAASIANPTNTSNEVTVIDRPARACCRASWAGRVGGIPPYWPHLFTARARLRPSSRPPSPFHRPKMLAAIRCGCCRAPEAQVKRRAGKLIWCFGEGHNVVSPLRPEYLLHGHSEGLCHLLEGFCPLGGVFSSFNA
jgi:hypothetical protein